VDRVWWACPASSSRQDGRLTKYYLQSAVHLGYGKSRSMSKYFFQSVASHSECMFCAMQVMLHELLAKTWGRAGFEAFVRRLQGQYARQAAVAAAAAEQQLIGLAEWQPVRAGMFMWFKLTGGVCCQQL